MFDKSRQSDIGIGRNINVASIMDNILDSNIVIFSLLVINVKKGKLKKSVVHSGQGV